MNEVYIVVEGKGEQAFVERILAVHLGLRGVFVRTPLVGKPGHKGGVRPWPAVRKELCNFLRMNQSGRQVYVSMLFDYFRMPSNWPGRADSPNRSMATRGDHIQESIAADIVAAMGGSFNPALFIPYVQMHEFEALVFAKPEILKEEFPDRIQEVDDLMRDVGRTPPEEINDGPTTAPGKRIIGRIPAYGKRKASAAANVLESIGLDAIRRACPRFDGWVSTLEQLVEGGR